MPNYSRNQVILVRYPFSDLSSSKVRPAIIVSGYQGSQDHIITPLTSRTATLHEGEFVLKDWQKSGLNVPSAVKRGIYTVHSSLVLKQVGQLSHADVKHLNRSLNSWLDLNQTLH